MKLNAHHISHYYHKHKWILENVEIEINSGEILGISAPSGYGKSTLAQILAGYISPVKGHVTLDGNAIPLKGYHPVQMIFQAPEQTLNPFCKIKSSLNEGWQVSDELKQSLKISEEWLDKWPSELSGGQLQRISIARALGPDTKFLLADEITTMLDTVSQAEIWHILLKEVERRALGILVFSHDQSLLERVCTKRIDLKRQNT